MDDCVNGCVNPPPPHTSFGSSYYETKAVFLAVGITALVCIVVTVFSFQTKVKTGHAL